MTPPFTLDGYQATVQAILDRDYSIASFHDVSPQKRHLILRHDIDQSIQRARALATCEAERGWRASYFVLLQTEMYNPWAPANAADLKAIMAMGHEVGLHFDAAPFADLQALETEAALQCEVLERLLDTPVRAISLHRPAPKSIGGVAPIAGRLHTYMARFVNEIGYCSDSRGEWRHGHPWEHPALSAGTALQLLAHAVWWVGGENEASVDRLSAVLSERAAVLDAELAANNMTWRLKPRTVQNT